MADQVEKGRQERDTELGGDATSETVAAPTQSSVARVSRADGDAATVAAESTDATIAQVSSAGRAVQHLTDAIVERPFAERYDRRRLLGAGGMGEVRLMSDQQIGRDVAMKVLRPHAGGSSPASRARFVREARVQAQLEHPAIVPVYDMGLTPDGVEYFTMKRIGGHTLADIIENLSQRDEETVRQYPRNKLLGAFRQVCLAVEYAHRRGVLHRDIKPQNLMLGELGELYVLDWGLAKVVDAQEREPEEGGPSGPLLQDGATAKSMLGALLGTPGYMAPEQVLASRDLDAKTDVYALGAVLFEILTLQRLHDHDDVKSLLESTVEEPHTEARMLDCGVAPELAQLCARATRLLPADRLATAQALADGVQSFLDGDRDEELRRRLAAKHAEAAELAIERAREHGGAGIGDRQRALSEAGRALALDPSSTEAAGTLMRLLLEPPPELPKEVVDAVDREETEEARAAARQGAPTYFVNGCIAILVGLVFGIRELTWIVLIFVPQWITALLCFLSARKLKIIRGHHILAIAAVSFFAIAADSGIAGALILVPAYAAANLILLSLPPMKGGHRAVHLALACAAILVPVALEYTGWVTPAYSFSAQGILVQARAVELPALALPLGAVAAIATALIGPAVIIWRRMDTMGEMRRKVQLQAWMLRQIIPRLPDAPQQDAA